MPRTDQMQHCPWNYPSGATGSERSLGSGVAYLILDEGLESRILVEQLLLALEDGCGTLQAAFVLRRWVQQG